MGNTKWPNWPGPLDSNGVPLQSAPVIEVPLHPSIQDARKAGAEEGTILAAPLAPATGPIDVKPESLVVVTAKNFFDTSTWTAIKAVLISAFAAIALTLGTTFISTWSSGKSIFDKGAVDWHATEIACEVSGGGIIVTAVMAWAKKHDNNPSV